MIRPSSPPPASPCLASSARFSPSPPSRCSSMASSVLVEGLVARWSRPRWPRHGSDLQQGTPSPEHPHIQPDYESDTAAPSPRAVSSRRIRSSCEWDRCLVVRNRHQVVQRGEQSCFFAIHAPGLPRTWQRH
eukprot:6117055-Pyramimonas_sp.AAC.1